MKYAKTTEGQQAFKDRSVALSARQRSAFILFDGQRTVTEVLTAAQGLGLTQEDVDYLVGMNLLAPVAVTAPAPAPAPAPAAAPAADVHAVPPAERYRVAYPLAVQLTAGMGLRGYRLSLAVESAGDADALLALLPRIQEAVGVEKCRALEAVLRS